MPVSETTAAPPGFAVTVSEAALLAPAVAGANTTEMLQVAPTARVIPLQVSAETMKSAAFDPPSAAADSAPVATWPVLRTENIVAVERTPTITEPKSRDSGMIASAPGASAVPIRAAEALPAEADVT